MINTIQKRLISPRSLGLLSAFLVFLVTSLTILLLVTLLYRTRRDAIRRDMIHAAVEVAQAVDPKLHHELRKPEQLGSEVHQKALAPLLRFHQNNPHLYYIFTMIYEDDKFYFVLDTATSSLAPRVDDNVQASAIMEYYEFSPEDHEAVKENVVARHRPFTRKEFFIGSFGTFVTAFAPILDEEGRLEGIAGVDFSLDSFQQEFAQIKMAALIAWAAALLLSIGTGIAVWRLSDALCRSRMARVVNEHRFKDLVHALPAMVIEVDRSGRIFFANEAARPVVGEVEEQGERLLETLVTRDDQAAFRAAFNRAQREGETTNTECWIEGRDGRRLCLAVRIAPLVSEEHEGCRVVMIDITEEKTIAEQVRQNEKLHAIGELAGGIAHDFNNQLGVIHGFCEIIERNPNDAAKVTKFIKLIHDAAGMSINLTRNLLNFARRAEFKTEPLDLREEIQNAVELLQHSIKKSVAIRAELPEESCWIYGDRSQFQNILLNLAINARDAMPKGGFLTFSLNRVSAAALQNRDAVPDALANYYEIIVTDTGVGMDEETRKRVFDPFFTTKLEGRGTGMGLASVSGSVKNHGGFVTCQSSRGAGTSFHVFLPVAEPGQAETPARTEKDIACCRGLRVMVVDDEENMVGVCSAMLEILGCKALTFVSPRDALAYYREHSFEVDVVIMDLMMPEMPGMDVLASMIAINPAMKAIVMTAVMGRVDLEQMNRVGVQAFITKPFELNELVTAISSTCLCVNDTSKK